MTIRPSERRSSSSASSASAPSATSSSASGDGADPATTADRGARTLVDHLVRAGQLAPDAVAFTFVDFAEDPLGHRTTITWAGLDRRVRSLAGVLVKAGCAGERVAVLAPQGIEYVIAFLGALRAGAVAVPLFPPYAPGHDDRVVSALGDAAPVCLLTTAGERDAVTDFCASRRLPGADRVLVVDAPGTEGPALDDPALDDAAPADPDAPYLVRPRPEDPAYLQYTSGSTGTPSGVEITHANVMANVRQAMSAYAIDADRNQIVSWLPLFHDMGLVLAVAIPVAGAIHSVLTGPPAFIQQPVRWLRLLADHPAAVTAAPNFAYDYCVRRVPEELRAELRLESVSVMINGSEPIRARTLSRFQDAFGPCGVAPTTVRPSYGLAEATVFVAASRAEQAPVVTAFDRVRLGRGTIRPATRADGEDAVELVSCGHPVGQEIAVVDAGTRRRLPEGAVGELWVRGPNVGRGYWRRTARSQEVFQAALADAPADADADADADAPAGDAGGRWLRTGDLGASYDGLLYITGRIKDLVIIDGTNHYPHDIESTVQEAHAVIRPGRAAAFALTVDNAERLVVVAEHSRRVADARTEREAVTRAVRKAVAAGHGVSMHDFVLAAPGTVPRTSSGKVARDACRRLYLDGVWAPSAASDLAGAGGEE